MQNMSVQTFSVSLGLAAAPGSKRCLLSCLPAYGQATINKIHALSPHSLAPGLLLE